MCHGFQPGALASTAASASGETKKRNSTSPSRGVVFSTNPAHAKGRSRSSRGDRGHGSGVEHRLLSATTATEWSGHRLLITSQSFLSAQRNVATRHPEFPTARKERSVTRYSRPSPMDSSHAFLVSSLVSSSSTGSNDRT